MDNDAIDFSSLDPTRDAARWENLINDVTGRGMNAHSLSQTVWNHIVSWSRSAIAAAVVVMFSILALTMIWGHSFGGDASPNTNDVSSFVQWALGQRSGSVWEEISYAGVDHDRP